MITYFLAKWIFIIFIWGGLGITIWWMLVLRNYEKATVDIKKLKAVLRTMILFIFLAAFGFMDILIMVFGNAIVQLINNFFVGVVFLKILIGLKKSIILEKK